MSSDTFNYNSIQFNDENFIFVFPLSTDIFIVLKILL